MPVTRAATHQDKPGPARGGPAHPPAPIPAPRGAERRTARARDVAWEAAAWDPLPSLASEIRCAFAEPVRRAVLSALEACKELSGHEVEVADDLAVDALWYALVALVTREEEVPVARRARLLQLLAAQVFYSERNPALRSPPSFWVFLNDLAAKYLGAAGSGGDAVELRAVLDRFLSYYDLDGPDNVDVVEGIERLVLPHLGRLRHRLQEVARLLPA